MSPHLHIDKDAITAFCRQRHIRRLALFGSVLRDDFRPGSDVDVLVEFEASARVGLLTLAGLELELAELIGAEVDLNTPGFLNRHFREQVLAEAEVVYDAA